jgi:hypothetical protein
MARALLPGVLADACQLGPVKGLQVDEAGIADRWISVLRRRYGTRFAEDLQRAAGDVVRDSTPGLSSQRRPKKCIRPSALAGRAPDGCSGHESHHEHGGGCEPAGHPRCRRPEGSPIPSCHRCHLSCCLGAQWNYFVPVDTETATLTGPGHFSARDPIRGRDAPNAIQLAALAEAQHREVIDPVHEAAFT